MCIFNELLKGRYVYSVDSIYVTFNISTLDRYYFHFHFTDMEIETREDKASCSRALAWESAKIRHILPQSSIDWNRQFKYFSIAATPQNKIIPIAVTVST